MLYKKLKIKNNKIQTEVSAGCVVYKKFEIRNSKFEIYFALGKHSGYHKWVLPKGLIEKGEDKIATAVRETEEELGIKVKVVNPKPIYVAKYFYYAQLKTQKSKIKTTNKNSKFNHLSRRVDRYQESLDSSQNTSNMTRVFKTVYFYLAEYVSGDIKKHGWEMEEAGWYAYEKALELMSFKDEKEAIKKAYYLLSK